MIAPCQSEEDYRRLLADSADHPVLLMKHSTRCPVSAAAHRQVEQFSEETGADCRQVLVIEQRPLSQMIAEESGVKHQSPQVILFSAGTPAGHLEHWSITDSTLKKLYSGSGFPTSR